MVVTTRLLYVETGWNAAWRFGLRGYDAVHCAAAGLLEDGQHDVVAASGDESLLEAWRNLGVRTFRTDPAR